MADTIDIYDVVDYGADITGVNDSTTAVRDALAAAVSNVNSTGRRSIVYFPGGKYSFLTKSSIHHIDLNNNNKIVLLGTPGGRSKLFLNGSAGGGDWYLFSVRGGSSDIEFRNLHMEMTGLSNPDPAEQSLHSVNAGNGHSDL